VNRIGDSFMFYDSGRGKTGRTKGTAPRTKGNRNTAALAYSRNEEAWDLRGRAKLDYLVLIFESGKEQESLGERDRRRGLHGRLLRKEGGEYTEKRKRCANIQ